MQNFKLLKNNVLKHVDIKVHNFTQLFCPRQCYSYGRLNAFSEYNELNPKDFLTFNDNL